MEKQKWKKELKKVVVPAVLVGVYGVFMFGLGYYAGTKVVEADVRSGLTVLCRENPKLQEEFSKTLTAAIGTNN